MGSFGSRRGGGVSGNDEPVWPSSPGATVKDENIYWLAKPDLLNSPSPNPDRDFNFRIFQAWVEHIRERVSFVTSETGRAIGPEFSKPKGTLDSAILNQLIATEKAELRLVAVAEKGKVTAYRLCKFESSVILCIGKCPKSDPEKMCREADGPGIAGNSSLLKGQSGAPAGKFKQPTFGVQLRSVQGIMYYLGELLRYQQGSGRTVFSRDRRVLFKLTDDKAFAEKPFVSTTYEDKTYYLAKPRKGTQSRAGNVLALVSQLLGLHKKSEELPTTTTIKTVGGAP